MNTESQATTNPLNDDQIYHGSVGFGYRWFNLQNGFRVACMELGYDELPGKSVSVLKKPKRYPVSARLKAKSSDRNPHPAPNDYPGTQGKNGGN